MTTPLDGTLAALADPARRRVVELLRQRPRKASELADALSVSRPAMSRHLRVLRQAGLIEQAISDEDARVRMIQLRRQRLAELKDWVEEVESFWCDQLAAFRAHVERRPAQTRRR